jgi:uncharacterized protein
MASGLAALLDDIATLTKMAAASLDDVAAAAGKAGTKAAGVVIDDTAVTPQYVARFSPDREIPIVVKIARGSLVNKLFIILPVALLLSAFFPQGITPLLMIGGAYLCFEGAEKVLEKLIPHEEHGLAEDVAVLVSAEHEVKLVKGAVRTDFILSAEIMAIALAEVKQQAASSMWTEAAALAVVAVAITVAVYGVVGLIVKMDDAGLALARRENALVRGLGRALVLGMPKVLSVLTVVGTVAMLWVGGQLILHGLGLHPAEWVGLQGGLSEWLADAAISGLFGLMLGALIVGVERLWGAVRRG